MQDPKKITKNRHLHTITQIYQAVSSQLMHVSTIGKKLVKQQYLLQMSPQLANFRSLMAEIGWRVWGTPANFNGFRMLASLLQRRHSPEANQTLDNGTLYIHFPGLFPTDGILPGANFTLRPSRAFSCIGSITARHSTSGRQPNFAAWYKEWNYGTFTESATYIWLGGHHVGHQPHSSSV